jgi:CHAD domain-containing protein
MAAAATLPIDPGDDAVIASPAFEGALLRDYACAELDRAIAFLSRRGPRLHEGVHQARKSLRRTRATLALGASALGPGADLLQREIARINRKLSRLRDAHALIETIDRLLRKDMARACAPVLTRVRRIAATARAERARQVLVIDPALGEKRAMLATVRAAVPALAWNALTLDGVRDAVRYSQQRVDETGADARASGSDNDWHRWRRRVRRLSQQQRALGSMLPEIVAAKKRCKTLAEQLGEAQDYALLRDRTGKRSPFSEADRSVLRALADEGTEKARQRIEQSLVEGKGSAPTVLDAD